MYQNIEYEYRHESYILSMVEHTKWLRGDWLTSFAALELSSYVLTHT